MENKYKVNEIVYAKADLSLAFTVRRYVDRMYYCRLTTDLNGADLVFFERELTNVHEDK